MKRLYFTAVITLILIVFPAAAEENIQVTILYDNTVFTEGTKADWGFACLIEGAEKTILFDTGTNPEILWHNLNTLKVDIRKVEQIVLSHEHGDHTGGLASVLEKKTGIPVYCPASFSPGFFARVKQAGASPVKVTEPVEICQGVWLTGEIQGPVNETGIILDTPQGSVVITGCAHPGIAHIVKRSRDIRNKKVHFVFGGFHLMEHSKAQVEAIIEEFREAGVVKCGATHCTGEQQIEWFKQAYGSNFVGMGVGRVIKIER